MLIGRNNDVIMLRIRNVEMMQQYNNVSHY